MMNELEAPWVGNPPEESEYFPPCPCCGDENFEYIFISKTGEVIGCDECIKMVWYGDWDGEL